MSVTPDVVGKYVVKVECQSYSARYTVIAIGVQTATVVAAPTNPDNTRTQIGVAEHVTLTILPDDASLIAQWSVADGTAGGTLSKNGVGHQVVFTAPPTAPGGGSTTLTATIHGLTLTVTFTVIEPENATAVHINDYYNGIPSYAGQGMNVLVTYNPTDVSFCNVYVKEDPVPATSRTGYFLKNPGRAKPHQPLPQTKIRAANTVNDNCYFADEPPPWSGGSMTWNIPLRWRAVGSGTTWQLLQTNTQVFTIIDARGGSYVSKQFQSGNVVSGTRLPTGR